MSRIFPKQRSTFSSVWLSMGVLMITLGLTAALGTLSLAAAPRAAVGEQAASDLLSPATVSWRDFGPTDLVTTLPVTSHITAAAPAGLEATTAAYAISTDAGANWNPWTTAGLTVGGTVSTTQMITLSGLTLPDSATGNLIRFRIQETGSELAASPDYEIAVDATPPGSPENLQATPGGWSNIASFAVSWQNPADVAGISGAWYKLDAPPAAPDDGAFASATTVISGISPAGNGEHALYVWLEDVLGRADHTSAAQTTLFLDQAAPAPPFGLQGVPARTWVNLNSFSETWTNPPDESGIVGAFYRINRAGQFPTDGVYVDTTNTLTDIPVPADGKHDLYVWLVDAAGNTDHNNRNIDPQVFWYDSTSPVSLATLDLPESPGGWYNTPVNVQFTADDGPNGSGIATIHNQLDAGDWSTLPVLQVFTEGQHEVAYYASDIAGNTESTRTLSVSLDYSAPAAELIADHLPAPSGWYTKPVTLLLEITDTLSGPGEGHFRLNGGDWQMGKTIQIAQDGQYDIEFYGEDVAGNQSLADTIQVKLDVTPPATAYLLDGVQGQGGWYTSPLHVHLVPSETGSGIAETRYRINNGAWQTGADFELTADGIYTLAFYSVDRAGNMETSFPVEVRLDTAPPSAPTAPQTTPAGWSRVNRFTVQWANPTDLSGIAGVYYRLNTEPGAPDDGSFAALTNRLDDLVVPEEGTHRLYLWLRDGAGNASEKNRALAPLLKYDATPPTTTLRVQGLVGDTGWHRSPITVELNAVDAHSGVATTHYRLGAGDWVAQTSLILDTQGKYVLEYGSEDAAGNVETTHNTTMRIDTAAPAAPVDLHAGPAGWQPHNNFRLTWREPLDMSGIAGVYVRFGGPPTAEENGVFHPASEVLEGLEVPGEGKHDIYVWLRDRAGNSDHTTAVALTDALWYDGTPPVTTVAVTGISGQNGWYLGPVRLTASATDAASGPAETRWQLDGGPWTVGGQLTVSADGEHTVQVASADVAGNLEAAQLFRVAIDRTAPIVQMKTLGRRQASPEFDVGWWGYDPSPGSGIAKYDIQMRDGLAGAWQNWLMNTTATANGFEGLRGHAYYFRVRARDLAGNETGYSSGITYAVVDAVRNGDFDTGNFNQWQSSGLLRKAVVPADGPYGSTVLAARLGSPEYGPSIEEPGQVPAGDATIRQTITVPPLTQVARPTLRLWHRVFSYDVFYSERLGQYVDTLEVTLHNASGQVGAPLLRTGNKTGKWGVLNDTGWQQSLIDLSPYAGQTLDLVIASYNRHDNLFNTWSFVDGIQVQDWPYNRKNYLPLLSGGHGAVAAAAADGESAAQAETPPVVRGKR